MKKTFIKTKGAHYDDKDAKQFGKRINEMMERLGREITPKDIVDDARSKNSVFHDFMEWDNSKAAESWRMWQARKILASVSVVIVTNEGKETTQRAYVNVTREDALGESKQVYVNIERALTDDDLRKQIIDKALGEALDWEARYKTYKELSAISKAIEQTATRFHKMSHADKARNRKVATG